MNGIEWSILNMKKLRQGDFINGLMLLIFLLILSTKIISEESGVFP